MEFSIIIPVYKVEKYLEQSAYSILSQSHKDFELILVDDGSPDTCPALCDSIAARDSRVKVIHKQNGGLSDARNAGLDIAVGEYVIFIDSDDWWSNPNALKKIHKVIDVTNCDILIFGMEKFNTKSGEFYDKRIPSSESAYITSLTAVNSGAFVACACDKVVRRNIIEDSAIRFPKGQLSEDIEWCIRLLHTNPKISVLPELIYVYRQNFESISHNVKRKNIEDILAVICQYSEKSTENEAVMNFLAVQYVLLIATSSRVKTTDIKDMLTDIKSLSYLLKYGDSKRVKIGRLFSPMGINMMRWLMGLYQKLRG